MNATDNQRIDPQLYTFAERVALTIGAAKCDQGEWYETSTKYCCEIQGRLRFRQHPHNDQGLKTRCEHGCQLVWDRHIDTCNRLRSAAGEPKYVRRGRGSGSGKRPAGLIEWKAIEGGYGAVASTNGQQFAVLQLARLRPRDGDSGWYWRYALSKTEVSSWKREGRWAHLAAQEATKWYRKNRKKIGT